MRPDASLKSKAQKRDDGAPRKAAEGLRFGYEAPRQLAENLWEIRGYWRNKFGRRMTVIRCSDGRVLIHNAIQLLKNDLYWLHSLGTVSWIVAPNIFHCSDAGWMNRHFPDAELYVPKEKLPHFIKQDFNPRDVNTRFPKLPEVEMIPFQGTKISEAVFLHKPSKTLILCDLSFNMEDVFTGLGRHFARWNRVGGRFGPSRLTRLLFTKDRRQVMESYHRLLTLDFDRVIVNHGAVLEAGGKEKLREGVREIFGE